jgi:tetratricopeptide (TPR) repeat protein
VGLIIILATAWIQSLPSTTLKEEAGEIPSDWQVAPADALASLRSGRVPHLTWGRAIMGGVAALGTLFLGTVAWVLVTGRPAPGFGPSNLGADEAAAGLAILPFSVTGGDELDLWREGMVDILSTNLDGMGGFRAIDSRTVMARWRERVGDDGTPDLRTALEVAGSTGARYGVVGNLVGNPGGVRLAADVYDLSSGEEITQSYVEGPADSVLALVSRLTVDLTRQMLASGSQQVVQAPRTAGITTESLDALREYLDGEAAYRRADFASAAAAFERAVDQDSTFALAWYRLSNAYAWLGNIGNEVSAAANQKVASLSDQLPLRERSLMLAVGRAVDERDLSAVTDIQEAATKYPDDPEVWFELGEFYLHTGIDAGVGTYADAEEVIGRAVSLDPSFAPYYIHYVEILVARDRQPEALAALETYRRLAGPDTNPHLDLAVELFGGDPAARQAALAGLDTVPRDVLNALWGNLQWFEGLDQEEVLEFFRAAARVQGGSQYLMGISSVLLAAGRIDEAAEALSDRSLPPWFRVYQVADMELLGLPVPMTLQEVTDDLDVCPDREDAGERCMFTAGALSAVRGDRDTWQMWVDRNQALGIRYQDEGQVAHGKEHESLAYALEGFWSFYQDRDMEAARASLAAGSTRLPGDMGYLTQLHLADASAAASPRSGARILERLTSGIYGGYAQVRLGRLREESGDVEGARRAYRRATEVFAQADAGHPYADEARAALERLGD